MPRIPRTGTLSGEKFLGEYGAAGGIIELFGDWKPLDDSPLEVSYEMLQLAGYLENTEVPLARAAAIAAEDTEKRFATQTDPDGYAWYPLDEDYLKSKLEAGYPADILAREGDLRKAATSMSAWRIEGDTLFFDPSGLPDYGVYHQTGSGDPDNIGMAFEHRETLRAIRSAGMGMPAERKGESQKENLGIGRGKALPQRRFIGLSEEAINAIAFEFDLWFEQGVEEIFTGGGVVSSAVFDPGVGRYRIPKGMPGAGRFTKGP